MGHSLVLEHSPSMCEALGSIPSSAKQAKQNKKAFNKQTNKQKFPFKPNSAHLCGVFHGRCMQDTGKDSPHMAQILGTTEDSMEL